MRICILGWAISRAKSQSPGDVCLGQCRELRAAGCCQYDWQTSQCLWSPNGQVNGASSVLSAASANCDSTRCDGWNWVKDCSGTPLPISVPSPSPPSPSHWTLVWSDEFDSCPNGRPDPANWGYENGYQRNLEEQWYTQDNAACVNGSLVITAKRERPLKTSVFEYTSSSLTSKGKKEFKFGRFEMRGKIPIESGSWPAFWTLGAFRNLSTVLLWPASGEVDIMEYYGGKVHANFAYAKSLGQPLWNVADIAVDESWAQDYHVWAMEWDASELRLYLDGAMVNFQKIAAANGALDFNPWRELPMFMMLSLAIGGQHGGDPFNTKFPLKFYVDYVRVYQSTTKSFLLFA